MLKPILPERLKVAVERAERTIELLEQEMQGEVLKDILNVRDGELIHEVKINDVILFASYGNYVKLQLANKTLLHNISLNALEQRLGSDKFFRAKRYTLVPLNKIMNIEKHSRSKIAFEMKVVCSERKTVAFRKLR